MLPAPRSVQQGTAAPRPRCLQCHAVDSKDSARLPESADPARGGPLPRTPATPRSLRNAIYARLSHMYGSFWLDDPDTGLDAGASTTINAARPGLDRSDAVLRPVAMVATPSLGASTAACTQASMQRRR